MIDPIVLMSAFRYALGRKTYVVAPVAEAIIDNWEDISETDKDLYVKEILDYRNTNGNLGMEMDEICWKAILKLRYSEIYGDINDGRDE